jgi:hypothetical protein
MPDDPSLHMSQDDFWLVVVFFTSSLVFYLLFCAGVGVIAKTKGRSFWAWTLLSLPITPVIAGVIVFIMEERPIDRKLPPPM